MTEGNGFELLRFMKQNPAFCVIPVFVLSGSTNPHHIREAYALGATGYLSKSSDLAATRTKIQALCEFMNACELVPANEIGDTPNPS